MRVARPLPGFPGRTPSTVELYRRGLPLERSYDLSAPLTRAIFRALQAYVSHEETLALEAGLRHGTPVYPPWRSPAVFEDDAWTLAAWKRGESHLPARERWRLASRLLRAMFSPAEARADDDFAVRPEFFAVGKGYVPPPGPLGPVAREQPLEPFWDGLAPLSALLRDALGPLVSQSEAARRLGLTPRAVTLKIERKEVRRLRVGRGVFVPTADVNRARNPRRPRRSSKESAAGTAGLDGLTAPELRTLAAWASLAAEELERRGGA